MVYHQCVSLCCQYLLVEPGHLCDTGTTGSPKQHALQDMLLPHEDGSPYVIFIAWVLTSPVGSGNSVVLGDFDYKNYTNYFSSVYEKDDDYERLHVHVRIYKCLKILFSMSPMFLLYLFVLMIDSHFLLMVIRAFFWKNLLLSWCACYMIFHPKNKKTKTCIARTVWNYPKNDFKSAASKYRLIGLTSITCRTFEKVGC